MDFNQNDYQSNEDNITDYNDRTEQAQETNTFEPYQISSEIKSPLKNKNNNNYVDDDGVYNQSAALIHQGSSIIEFSLIVNKYQTEYVQQFSNDVQLDQVVNHFKKVTGDDELIPCNFKIPKTQINHLQKKGELQIKWLIQIEKAFLKCESNNQKWNHHDQSGEDDEIPIV